MRAPPRLRPLAGRSLIGRALAAPLLAAPLLTGCTGRPAIERPRTREPLSSLPPGVRLLDATASVPSAAAAALGGQPVQIDLPTVLELSGEKPNAIRLARERLAEAESRTNEGLALALPSVSIGGVFWRHTGVIQTVEGAFIETTKQRLFLGAIGVISLDVGRGALSYLAARRTEAQAEADIETARQAEALRAIEAYYELVAAQAAIAIAEDALDHAKGFQQVALSREKAKLGLRVDTLRADAQVASARHDAIQAEKRFRIASASLANALRLDPVVVLVAADKAVHPITFVSPERPVSELVAEGLANRPDLRALGLRVESADLEDTAARVGPFLPTFYAGVGSTAGGLGGAGFEGENFGSLRDRADYFVGAGWTFTGLGLGEWAHARTTAARLRAAQVQRDDQQDRVGREIVETHASVRAESAGIEAAEDELKAADEARTITRKRLEQGTGLAIDVLAAEEVRTRAATRVVESIVAYNKAQYRLLIQVGDRPAR